MNRFEEVVDLEYWQNNKKEHEFGPMVPFYGAEQEKVLSLFDEELETVLGNELWKTLSSYTFGYISIHTTNVIYRTLRNNIYLEQYDPYE